MPTNKLIANKKRCSIQVWPKSGLRPVDSTLTACPRRSVGSRDPNPCTMQAEVYSAHSVRRPESPQGLGRELFTRAGLMVFVSVRCLCGAAHVTLHSLTRAHTHVGPLLLMLHSQPNLPSSSSDRQRISSTTYLPHPKFSFG